MDMRGAGSVLEALRLSRGLTQTELASITGVSQAVLSKIEAGVMAIGEERLGILAHALGAETTLFGEPIEDGARVFHRKRASLPVSADKRIRATARLLQVQASALLGSSTPELSLTRRPLPANRLYTPSDRARETRAELGLGDGPIPDLIAVLERAGVLVIREDLASLQVDAIAIWPTQGIPVVFLGSHAPTDRQRFTTAHELGHAIMHEVPSAGQEAEADEFASEFLMPRKSILRDLDDIRFTHLVELKAKWGVSIAALGRRAYDLGQMSERQYRNFNIEMASTGMNRAEPHPLPHENPKLIREFVTAELEAGTNIDALARRAHMTPEMFITQFALEAS